MSSNVCSTEYTLSLLFVITVEKATLIRILRRERSNSYHILYKIFLSYLCIHTKHDTASINKQQRRYRKIAGRLLE